jgi:hypothetical protein
MLTVDFDDLMLELDEGTIKHVGASNKSATAKLYHVQAATAREFGDSQVKLAFDDGEGNEVEIALDPDVLVDLADQIESVRDEGAVFE